MNPLGNSPSYLPEMYAISGHKTLDLNYLSNFETWKGLETLIEQNSRDSVQQWIIDDLTGKSRLSWEYPYELTAVLGEIYLKGIPGWQEPDLGNADLYLNYAQSNLNLMENHNELQENLLKICSDLTQPLRHPEARAVDALNLTELKHLIQGFQSSRTLDRIIELYSNNSLQHLINLLKDGRLGDNEESALDAIFLAEICLRGLGEIPTINLGKTLYCLNHTQGKLEEEGPCGWEKEQLQICNVLISLVLQENVTSLIQASFHNYCYLTPFLKSHANLIDFRKKTFLQENLLHIMVKNNYVDKVIFFKQDHPKLVEEWLNERNLFGESPLDYALQLKRNSMISQFLGISNDEVTLHPQYGQKPIFINQKAIIAKMWDYMKLHGRPTLAVPNGQCNGFVLSYLDHLVKGETTEFYEILKTLRCADLTSLERLKLQKLPEMLSTKYHNLDDLFEQMINDIIWLQANSEDHPLNGIRSRNLFAQMEHELLFKFVKSSSTNTLNSFECTSPSMSEECMTDWFAQIVKQGLGTIVKIGDHDHTTLCFVTSDAKLKYYDPNLPKEIFACNPKELANFIFETRYKKNEKIKMRLSIFRYRIEKPSFEWAKPENDEQVSPNGFSPMHIAIFNYDIETIKKLLEDKKNNPNNKENQQNLSPLQLAIGLNKNEIASFLISDPSVDINENSEFSVPMLRAIMCNNEDMFIQLLKKDHLNTRGILSYIVEKDRNNLLKYLLDHKPDILDPEEDFGSTSQAFKALPLDFFCEGRLMPPLGLAIHLRNEEAISLLMQKQDGAVFKKYFRFYADTLCNCTDVDCIKACVDQIPNIDQITDTGTTFLLMAIGKGNYVLVKHLMEKGASKDIMDSSGITPVALAKSMKGDITDPDDNRVKINKLLI